MAQQVAQQVAQPVQEQQAQERQAQERQAQEQRAQQDLKPPLHRPLPAPVVQAWRRLRHRVSSRLWVTRSPPLHKDSGLTQAPL